MGVVYVQEDLNLGRRVARWRILPDALDSPKAVRCFNFEREARAASVLNHRHI